MATPSYARRDGSEQQPMLDEPDAEAFAKYPRPRHLIPAPTPAYVKASTQIFGIGRKPAWKSDAEQFAKCLRLRHLVKAPTPAYVKAHTKVVGSGRKQIWKMTRSERAAHEANMISEASEMKASEPKASESTAKIPEARDATTHVAEERQTTYQAGAATSMRNERGSAVLSADKSVDESDPPTVEDVHEMPSAPTCSPLTPPSAYDCAPYTPATSEGPHSPISSLGTPYSPTSPPETPSCSPRPRARAFQPAEPVPGPRPRPVSGEEASLRPMDMMKKFDPRPVDERDVRSVRNALSKLEEDCEKMKLSKAHYRGEGRKAQQSLQLVGALEQKAHLDTVRRNLFFQSGVDQVLCYKRQFDLDWDDLGSREKALAFLDKEMDRLYKDPEHYQDRIPWGSHILNGTSQDRRHIWLRRNELEEIERAKKTAGDYRGKYNGASQQREFVAINLHPKSGSGPKQQDRTAGGHLRRENQGPKEHSSESGAVRIRPARLGPANAIEQQDRPAGDHSRRKKLGSKEHSSEYGAVKTRPARLGPANATERQYRPADAHLRREPGRKGHNGEYGATISDSVAPGPTWAAQQQGQTAGGRPRGTGGPKSHDSEYVASKSRPAHKRQRQVAAEDSYGGGEHMRKRMKPSAAEEDEGIGI